MSKPGTPKLTPKQRRFVDEYLIDLNASAATRRAGYSKKSSGRFAQELLLKPHIQAHIQKRLADREKRTEITQDRVLEEYAALAFADPRQYFDSHGNVVPVPKLSKEAAAAIAGFDVKRTVNDEGEFFDILKIKLADKRASLSDVAKHLGMFEKDNRQKGEHEIFVTIEDEEDDDYVD